MLEPDDEDGALARLGAGLPFVTTRVVEEMAAAYSQGRLVDAEGFTDILHAHRERLEGLGLIPEDFVEEDPETFTGLIEQETGRQIRHNFDAGLITAGETAGTFRYSWRGLIYLYCQLVKDMVRMS